MEIKRSYNKNNKTFLGKHHTEEAKRKMSDSAKKRPPMSEETRKKLSNATKGKNNPNFGKHHSEETRKKIREGVKNRVYTEETIRKMRIAHKSENNAMFGKHHSEETRKKISQSWNNRSRIGSRRGVHLSEETKRKIGEKNKGKRRSEETRKKLSDAGKNKPGTMKGKHHTEESRRKMIQSAKRGEKSVHWKGGGSFGKYCPIFNPRFKEGVRKIYNYTCMICGHVWRIGEKKLCVHHVYYNKKSCCEETTDGHYIHTLPEGEKVLVKGNPNKFVTLCPNIDGRYCHTKTNHNRLYWALYFEKRINEKYGGISYIPNQQK